ncbi:MAG: hypothetical protein KBT45_08000 [Bacteroidales bacterium]|nr:hypothetical protein [Candidatus Colimorpha pelethequi]
MQKLKIKQLDGVSSPLASDDWSALTDQLATAAATNDKITKTVNGAIGNALQSVSGGTAESGKYISSLSQDGTAIKVGKNALPVTGVTTTNKAGSGTTTKAIVALSLESGKVVATEKTIEIPASPILMTESVDFASEISLSKSPYGDQSVLVFVNGLLQSPADFTVSSGKVIFKDTSLYAKGDTVNLVYMAV